MLDTAGGALMLLSAMVGVTLLFGGLIYLYKKYL
mgnify:CR=1 FL=1